LLPSSELSGPKQSLFFCFWLLLMLGHNLLAHGFAFGCGSVSLKPWAGVIVFVVTAFGAESSDAAVGCSLSPVGVTTDFAGVYFLW
jgi:hypothetical protein